MFVFVFQKKSVMAWHLLYFHSNSTMGYLTEFFDPEVWPLHSTLAGQITIQENKSETISAMLLLMDLYIVKHNVL